MGRVSSIVGMEGGEFGSLVSPSLSSSAEKEKVGREMVGISGREKEGIFELGIDSARAAEFADVADTVSSSSSLPKLI